MGIITIGDILNIKIGDYYLDNQQMDIVLNDDDYLLVVAGAGSGKTLTILGKIYYLINVKGMLPNEILCISFTKASANSLKEKIKKEFSLDVPVYTFHKLALEILKENNLNYEIADDNTLENIIHEFFEITILNYPQYMKLILYYFSSGSRGKVREKYLNFYKNNYNKLILFEKLIATFIHLIKCNNFKLESFSFFLKQARRTFSYKTYKREKIFLILALNLYLMYEDYLSQNKEIDFDDMIINATNQVNSNGIKSRYKYVIIDEYQDTSFVRFSLIKEILDKTGAKLMVVGDDFQSIYRFTGCDLSLFLKFNDYFSNAKIMKIENTYRNSQELIAVAGDFVMRNKNQIRKNLHSNKHLDFPIQIIYYENIKSSFISLIIEIYNDTKSPILILGRNNKDINLVLSDEFKLRDDGNIIYTKNLDIKLKYLTVHKSKGLEEENVVIINLENSFLGFPNQIKDDRVLRFVSKSFEKYLYSEERRLFYVALTRTKNKVYLLVSKKKPSVFVLELSRNYKKFIATRSD